jgi:hypothetical protein
LGWAVIAQVHSGLGFAVHAIFGKRLKAPSQSCQNERSSQVGGARLPSLGITNRAAKGRSAVWTEGEVVRLFKRSWREGYHGLGAVIAPNVGRADIRPHAPDRFHDNWQSEFLGFAYAAIGAPVAANASVCRFARSAGPVFCSQKMLG